MIMLIVYVNTHVMLSFDRSQTLDTSKLLVNMKTLLNRILIILKNQSEYMLGRLIIEVIHFVRRLVVQYMGKGMTHIC